MNVESIWSESQEEQPASTKSPRLRHLWEKSSKKLEREGEGLQVNITSLDWIHSRSALGGGEGSACFQTTIKSCYRY